MQRGEDIVRNILKWFIVASIVLSIAQDITFIVSPEALPSEIGKDTLNNTSINNPHQTTSASSQKPSSRQTEKNRINNSKFEQTKVMLIQLGEGQSYQSAYNDLKQKMDFMHPQILVVSEIYPLPPMRKFLSKVISIGQTALLIIGVGGRFIPAISQNHLYQRFQQKSMLILIGGYFGLNMVQKMISSTGAFQVLLNGQVIYSKLQMNRLPILQDLTDHL